jgi:hypothetical protein
MSKKKEVGKKDARGEAEDDLSTNIFYNSYCKKSKELASPLCPQIVEEYNNAVSNEAHVENVRLLSASNH